MAVRVTIVRLTADFGLSGTAARWASNEILRRTTRRREIQADPGVCDVRQAFRQKKRGVCEKGSVREDRGKLDARLAERRGEMDFREGVRVRVRVRGMRTG